MLGGDVLGGLGHRVHAEPRLDLRVDEPPAERRVRPRQIPREGRGRLAHHERRPRHALDAAGNDERGFAKRDGARARCDRFEARPAQTVHRRARRRRSAVPPGASAILATLRLSSPAWFAHPNSTSSSASQSTPRIAIGERPDGHRREIVGAHGRQRATISAEWRSDSVAEVDRGQAHERLRCAVPSAALMSSAARRRIGSDVARERRRVAAARVNADVQGGDDHAVGPDDWNGARSQSEFQFLIDDGETLPSHGLELGRESCRSVIVRSVYCRSFTRLTKLRARVGVERGDKHAAHRRTRGREPAPDREIDGQDAPRRRAGNVDDLLVLLGSSTATDDDSFSVSETRSRMGCAIRAMFVELEIRLSQRQDRRASARSGRPRWSSHSRARSTCAGSGEPTRVEARSAWRPRPRSTPTCPRRTPESRKARARTRA